MTPQHRYHPNSKGSLCLGRRLARRMGVAAGLLYSLLYSTLMHASSVVIFNGAGTCDGCAESVATVLRRQYDQIQLVDETTLSHNTLAGATIYVQPGGSDDITETLHALTGRQIQQIQQFVAAGGTYVGICAGGYLAAQYADNSAELAAFGLIELHDVDAELGDDMRPQLLNIQLAPAAPLPQVASAPTRHVYMQAGPHFGQTLPKGAKALAYYANSKRIAARVSPFGRGKVVVIGPHLEADATWFMADGLPQPPLQQQLLLDILASLTITPAISGKPSITGSPSISGRSSISGEP